MIHQKILLALFLYSLILGYGGVSFAQNIPLSEPQIANLKNDKDGYSYKYEGRNDPFRPFVSKKKAATITSDPNEIVEDKIEYSGMQLFEPGQLRLVGVMLTKIDPMALVEDQTKKGYVLKLGSLIGKRGMVTAIESQQVIVTETAKTRAGNEIKSTTTMRMKLEGDK